eukprot:TRINITY_DN50182_c0_g1_i1.p1 TRINITY_DN50182_c0_g1~~TRINITY_DN50182_c0_g1_i1.p1  ORF type:complete len:394 (-),score=35.89 TRINITY_DN50182_c0_g1_i1:45-1226(-)
MEHVLKLAILHVTICMLVNHAEVASAADCSSAPNCTSLRRQPCSERAVVPNACGDCLPGTFGAKGPMNTVCLSKVSCAAIHPGEDTCEYIPGAGQATPFIFPFGRCVCDDGTGRYWPTSPGKCAQVVVTMPLGSGYYEVQECTSRTCEPGTCTPLATWPPDTAQRANNVSFPCASKGDDSIQLVDDCEVITSRQTYATLCAHAGFAAISTVFDALGEAPVDCELAPRCPPSVLETTRMQQSCCFGTIWSNKMNPEGVVSDQAAPGFCPMVSQAGLAGGNDSNVSDAEAVSNSTVPYECLVRTIGPGWTGCACVDSNGQTVAGQTCTVSCEEPHCSLPRDGIRPVPIDWLSSEVSHQLLVDHGKLAGVSFARRHELCWLQTILVLCVACAVGFQ